MGANDGHDAIALREPAMCLVAVRGRHRIAPSPSCIFRCLRVNGPRGLPGLQSCEREIIIIMFIFYINIRYIQ